ncbi:hypothetical protein ABH966_003901 [Lysinibacillus sp. RC46]|uniref:hypothetical protein n=1 Tax=unclassified Lysinibacillus TaxID=2636778 RepID=UPI0035173B99
MKVGKIAKTVFMLGNTIDHFHLRGEVLHANCFHHLLPALPRGIFDEEKEEIILENYQ